MFSRLTGRLCTSFAVALVVLSSAAAPTSAQDAAAFYKGKTVKFIVGNAPGGGFDAYARMLAPHLEKQLGATVVVQNQPGAGGLVALNSVYKATGDGLQLMMVNGLGGVLAQLVDDPSVRFDLSKMGVLGIVSYSPWIWIASPKSPMKSPADFLKPGAKVTWAGSGQMGGLSDGAAITCAAFKMDCKIVRGYDGSATAALALARGEADAMYVSDTSANNYVKAGNAIPILTMSSEKSEFFPKLPTVFEAVKLTAEQKWWFEFREAVDDLQRILAMPPNVPKEQLAYMQQAVAKVLTDPAVIEEGKKGKRYIKYRDPVKVRSMIGGMIGSITPEQKKIVKEVLLKE